MKRIFLALFLFAGLVDTRAEKLYVSPDGADRHNGSQEQPFGSLAKAVDVAKPGDQIILAAGRYYESIRMSGRSDIIFSAEPDDQVIIDGTTALPKEWTPWKEGIWKQSIDHDIWQLFVNDQMAYVARWPDATFEDGKIWRMMAGCRSADGGFDKHKGGWVGKTRFGILYDDKFHEPDTKGFREGDARYLIDPTISFDDQPSSLASSGKDFSGALAVLNIGHWLTWTRPIIQHGEGSDHFTYSTNDMFVRGAGYQNIKHPFSSYHILGLAALDQVNEWWFDKDTKTVYYKPPVGMNPNQMDVFGRTEDFGLELSKCNNIDIKNITFFGAGFWVQDCVDVLVQNCTFDYASAPKFILGAYDWFENFNPQKNPNKIPSFYRGKGNQFINCVMRRCNSPIAFDSDGMRVENCSFSDIEWQVNSNGGSGSVMIGKNGIFRRNTVTRGGNCEGVRAINKGALVELNRISDVSNLQHDGSAINVGTTKQRGTRVAYNWVYDTCRQGVRFDYHGMGIYREDGKIHGDGVYMNNVTWNTRPNEIKGDRHLILNNTIVSVTRYPNPFKEEVTMSIQGFKALHDIEGNMGSLIRNNIGTMKNRSWNLGKIIWNKKRKDGYKIPRSDVIPGTAENNIVEPGASWKHLRDPKNYDFRPKPNSPLVDAGLLTTRRDLPSPDSNFTRMRYAGAAPDIGAYEHNSPYYWIPGRLEKTATMPIPKNRATEVPIDADLMYLEAYKSEKHEVYFGESPASLKLIKRHNSFQTNITPVSLNPASTYYWRVDAIAKDGTRSSGSVWSFKTDD